MRTGRVGDRCYSHAQVTKDVFPHKLYNNNIIRSWTAAV